VVEARFKPSPATLREYLLSPMAATDLAADRADESIPLAWRWWS
jgi:hypothetical protein